MDGITHRNAQKKEKEVKEKKNNENKEKKENIFQFIQRCFRDLAGKPSFPTFTLSDCISIIIVTIISVITSIYKIYQPNSIVFDEVYFGNFSKYYNTGEYFFDIHPPLAKLILGFAGYLAEMNLTYDYSEIEKKFESNDYIMLRSTNALFGAMRSPLLYITSRICGASTSWAFLSGLLPAFDNALITESRHILTEGILTFFVCLSLMCMAIAATEQYYWTSTFFVALSCACAGCTKFTALGLYFAVAIIYIIHYPFYKTVIAGFIMVIVFFLVLFTTFGLHFYLLPYPGEGCAYHDEDYCNHLEEFKVIPDTLNLIKIMLTSNFALESQEDEPSASMWYQWPFMAGKAVYMHLDPDYNDAQIWCIGTPTVWYTALIGLILFVIFLSMANPRAAKNYWLLCGYLASYMPMALISRPMYNYHYFIPLIFTFVMTAVVGDMCFGKSWFLPLILCCLNAVCFIYFAPLTYGEHMDYDKIEKRFWFSCWNQ